MANNQEDVNFKIGKEAYIGGDVLGRDKIILNFYPSDIDRLVKALRSVLPEGDPAPQQLAENLKNFELLHSCLAEWKELHNLITDIQIALSPFLSEVDRIKIRKRKFEGDSLLILWRPARQRILILLDWSEGIHFIGKPAQRGSANFIGERWMVDINGRYQGVEEILREGITDISILHESAHDLNDVSDRHLFWADKKLRDAAGELCNLSRFVLGK